MGVPDGALELIERFDRNKDAYRSGQYNEAQVRREFIDPLFELLGWDIENKQGYAEAYKDVIHEDAIKVGGATKAPDYCFRIGGTRKFFLEAKKPSVSVDQDIGAAYQLRRYAWSAKLPLSILTDFEEFAAYDCRIKPVKTDKASAARIMYLTCTDYADRWDEIASVFSRDAVLKGSFDKYAESTKAKKGTAEVDDEFLREIESWRDTLARNLALRNPGLSQRELNFAVQRTIDRLIFLRICEDRGLEGYGRLMALQNGGRVYERLLDLFHQADDRYNSGLFHFQKEKDRLEPPDYLTPELSIDDKVLKETIKNLYYPDSPYEFSVLPADILGQVYEQFLGKVIRLTAGHRAKVEGKPEVKKAGGVYYTPTYIVDYIVKHTVGKLLEGKTPKQAAKLRILDPACGSGSFLIGAYQYLLDWHQDWYVTDGPEKHRKELYQGPGGAWRLTAAVRKRILLDNIYGVDIDSQAVEVTKLSLLLKVLEQESAETIDESLRFFRERALPDLGSNIKCGNSLIGPDFYDNQQMSFLDDEERLRINTFDWQAEFPEIMKSGGFDAVIGNPPWGQKDIAASESEKRYIRERLPSCSGIFDLFRPFVERGIALTRDSGRFGMVLPDIVLLKDYQETRRHVLEHLRIEAIDWWGTAFASAVIDAATVVGSKGAARQGHLVRATIHDPESPLSHEIPQADFWTNPRYVFNLYLTPQKRRMLAELASCPRVGDYFEIHEGVHSGNVRAELFVKSAIDESCRELLFGRDEIAPYSLRWRGSYVRLQAAPTARTRERYANLGRPDWYDRPKVLVRRTGDFVLAAVDRHGRYASNNFFVVFPKAKCSLDLDGLCALLNSRFMTWYFRAIEPRQGRVFAELKIKHLNVFPLPAQVLEQGGCGQLNGLGTERAALASKVFEARTPDEAAAAKRGCEYLDRQIDSLVQELLGICYNTESDQQRPCGGNI